MAVDDIQEDIKTIAQTAHAARPLLQGLFEFFKREPASKPEVVTNHEQAVPEVVTNHEEAVRDLLRENARDTVATLTLTTEAAFHILGPDFATENVLDPTWEKRWVQGAANVASEDEERRTWWSRLLAGEIQKPGTFSLRTLSTMDNLSPAEAQLFRNLCSCVWRTQTETPILLMPDVDSGRVWGMTGEQARILEETGLASHEGLGFALNFEEGKPRRFQNGDLDLFVMPTAKIEWRCTTIELTTSGRELLNLVDAIPDPTYQEEMIKELKKHARVLHAVKIDGGWNAGSEVEIDSIVGE